MPETNDAQRALEQGAARSLRACSPPARDPASVAIWRRYKWTIIGLGLFLLLDFIVGVAAGLGGARH